MNRDAGLVVDLHDADLIGREVHVLLLHVPDCPLVDRVRAMLRRSIATSHARITVEEIEGPYPSPTLLIDGIDVTGRTPDAGSSCRLDLPTEEDILAVLSAASIQECPS